MKSRGNVGVSGKMGRVMSPTSYRAAPPRTECDRENLLHSASSVNNRILTAAHGAQAAPGDWDQNEGPKGTSAFSVAEGAVRLPNRFQPLSKLVEIRVQFPAQAHGSRSSTAERYRQRKSGCNSRAGLPARLKVRTPFPYSPAAGRMPAHLKESRHAGFILASNRSHFRDGNLLRVLRLVHQQIRLTSERPRAYVSPMDPAPGRRGVCGALHFGSSVTSAQPLGKFGALKPRRKRGDLSRERGGGSIPFHLGPAGCLSAAGRNNRPGYHRRSIPFLQETP
jgi:hypothetical protein